VKSSVSRIIRLVVLCAGLGLYLPVLSDAATPTVAEIEQSSNATPSQTQTVDMPDGTVAAGDLLFIFVAVAETPDNDVAPVITAPSGWTVLKHNADIQSGGVDVRYGIYARSAVGDEGGGTETEDIFTDVDVVIAANVWHITGWGGTVATDIDIAELAQEVSNNPDPPSVTADWGSDTNLFITFLGYNDDDGAISTYPSGYINTTNTSALAGTDSSCSVATCSKAATSASDDPGAWLIDQAEGNQAFTLVVKPAAAGPTGPPVGTMILLGAGK